MARWMEFMFTAVTEENRLAIESAVKELGHKARSTVIAAFAGSRPLTKERQREIYRFTGFHYDQDGAHVDGCHTEPFFLPSCTPEEYDAVVQEMKETKEYKRLSTIVDDLFLEWFMEQFVGAAIRGIDSETPVAELSIDFLKALSGEPLEQRLTAQLDGIVVTSDDALDFWMNEVRIVFRKTELTDIEKEVRWIESQLDASLPPSAILDIRMLSRHGDYTQIRDLLLQSLAVMRLYTIASVDYRSFTTDLKGFPRPPLATGTSGQRRQFSTFKSVIDQAHVCPFIVFWKRIGGVLPPDCYRISPDNPIPLRIAYQRYTDALLSTSINERTITDAIMALESLLLPSKHQGELGFRLRTYAGKLLGVHGLKATVVKNNVREAYDIRSSFVHGGHLSKKERQSIDRKHGSLKQFVETLLNYVRICLITYIFLPKEMNKDRFLNLIGDSLIDEQADTALREILKESLEVLTLCQSNPNGASARDAEPRNEIENTSAQES